MSDTEPRPVATRAPSRVPSRVPSRMGSRYGSRAGSVASTDTKAAPIENLSFVSHISKLGRGAGGTANLENIAAAAAILTGGAAHRSGLLSGHDESPTDEQRTSGPHTPSRPQSAADTASVQPPDELELPEDVSFWTAVKQFIVVGYPLTLSALAQFSLNTVIVSVNGKMLGDLELGGASLAVGLINATGFAFGAGLCGALETVLSHTYGAFERETHLADQADVAAGGGSDHHHMHSASGSAGTGDSATLPAEAEEPPRTLYLYGTYAQRMAIILVITAFPLGVILCFADSFLQSLGEGAAVIHYTGIWCRYAVFGIPATLAFQLIQRYFSCQSVTKPLSVAMVAAALLNPILQIVFVYFFGFRGSPIAWLILMTSIVVALLGYLWRSGLYKLTWGGWDDKAFKNLGSLTKLAGPSLGIMLSEWVAVEVNALASGFAPTEELAAFSITLQVFGIMWGCCSGPIILCCVFVGNAVGARKPMLARRIAFIGMVMVFCLAIMDCIIFFALGPIIPWLFTSDPKVVALYHRLMWIVFPYHVIDTAQSCTMAILRGCELQTLGAIIITIVFVAVGLPLSFLLFFYFDIGVQALWIGPFSGVLFIGLPSYIYLLSRYIQWDTLKPHTDGPVIVEDSVEDDQQYGYEHGGGDGHAGQEPNEFSPHHALPSSGEDYEAHPFPATASRAAADAAAREAGETRLREFVDNSVRQVQKGTAAQSPTE